MTDRTTLPYDVQRCTGQLGVHVGCKQRMSCQRYLAFTQWDREAGIPDSSWTPVAMAIPNCQIKIDAQRITETPLRHEMTPGYIEYADEGASHG